LIELLRTLNEEKVEYLIVGGYAVMKYSERRFTKVLDIWIENSQENGSGVYRALARFGVPLEKNGLGPADFASADLAYQIGVEPARVDILTHVTAVEFATAWKNKVSGTLFGVSVNISLGDLLANKRAPGRAGDAEQLPHLLREMEKRSEQ
jgi:hypothetical protein